MCTTRQNGVRGWRSRLAIALGLLGALPGAQALPLYSIDFHALGSAANVLANSCFRLSGSISDPAPGFSADVSYSLYAGFWAAAPGPATDELFFYGFEGC